MYGRPREIKSFFPDGNERCRAAAHFSLSLVNATDFLTKADPSSTFLLFILSCSCKTSQYRMGRFYSLICLIRSAVLEKCLPVRPHTHQRLCRDWNTFCICSPAVDMRDGIRLKKPLPLCPIAALEAFLFDRAL